MRWQLLAVLVAALCNAQGAQAQTYSAYLGKAVRFIVPYPPGGATDIMSRSVTA